MNDTKKIFSRDLLNREQLNKLTAPCYSRAIKSLGLDYDQARFFADRHAIDVAYCKEVRKLPTNQLEWIINGHLDDVVCRADFTIDNILEELAERYLLGNETSGISGSKPGTGKSHE